MFSTLKTIALAGLASVMMVGASAAATVYDAKAAGGHSFWFGNNPFGGDKRWKFEDNIGTFATYTQGGMEFATLTGIIKQRGNASNQMQVKAIFNLNGVGDAFRGTGRKCGSVGNAAVGCNGDDLWSYYDYDSVVLNGIGDLAGLGLELTDHTEGKIPAQLGDGANDKNGNFGFSTWFDWEVTKTIDGFAGVGTSGKGDINLSLDNEREGQDPEPVPLPAGGVLLLTALGGLGIARRRKAKANA